MTREYNTVYLHMTEKDATEIDHMITMLSSSTHYTTCKSDNLFPRVKVKVPVHNT